jgi:hypothetical protein
MRGLKAQLHRLRNHLGRREDMIAAIALAVLAVGSLSFTLITHTGTPAGAALAYMAAVDRADTEYVWSHSIVNALNGSTPNATFLDRAALDAQLKATAHSRSAIGVQSVNYVSEGTRVVVTYNTSSGAAKTSLIMRGGAPHSWPVLVKPAGLDIALPPGAGALAIDGRNVEANGNELKLAVLPGIHAITLGASEIYESYSAQIDAEAASPALTPVSFAKVLVTGAGSTQAKLAVIKAFQLCVTSKSLAPSGCPQALPETDLATGGVRWTLLGDPTSDSKVGLDDQSVLEVSGHFVMKLSYGSERLHRDRLLGVGSSFIAGLAWDGQTLKLSSFRDASAVADLGRPAVTDPQVLSALKAQFNACLAIHVAELPGCPQSVIALFASKFVWHETSDPAHGATLAWDGKRSLFTVAGSYAFSVAYNSTPPYTPTQRIQDSSSGEFTADLYWDGVKVVFVGLEK